MAVTSEIPAAVGRFLEVATPRSGLNEACRLLPELLLDHANCELKAASTALGFIYRYPDKTQLSSSMSRLAREELRHFEQVRKVLDDRNIAFRRLSASRYASALRQAVRPHEPERLMDMLMVGALIEARSCERFGALVPLLPADLASFYKGLLASEARHFEHYLGFARTECRIGDQEFDKRLAELLALENTLVTDPDAQFRFHSGAPSGPG
jgi:tRNA-(ms[2]io[6]A)-hydroxylase